MNPRGSDPQTTPEGEPGPLDAIPPPGALDAIPVPVLAWREDGAILAANQAAAVALGYARDALLKMSYWDLTPAGQKTREIALARQRQAPYGKELVRASGTPITVRVVGIRPIANGAVAAHLAAFIADTSPGHGRDIDAALRRQNTILLELAKSDVVDSGDLTRALAAITEAAAAGLGCERSSVWIYTEREAGIRCLDLFRLSERDHTAGTVLFANDFPSYFSALAEDRSIVANDAHTHPATREFSQPYLAPLGICSMLDAPIRLRGKLVGVLCNEHVGAFRSFTQEEENFAASLADVVARGLEAAEARRAEATLEQAKSELELHAATLEKIVASRTGELEERNRENVELISRLHAALDALSTPVIEVWEGTLAMPLIGALDQARGERATERLLAEVVRTRARCVILDLTGMELIDAPTAAQVLKMTRAVELLGSFCLLTGVKPEVAQAMVGLDTDLPKERVERSIKQALRRAMELERRAR
jgi:rsbT co-antagonist protein RsbR